MDGLTVTVLRADLRAMPPAVAARPEIPMRRRVGAASANLQGLAALRRERARGSIDRPFRGAMIIFKIVGIWCALSVPASLLVGRWIRGCTERRR